MIDLSGADQEKLVKLLGRTLSVNELESFVYASTGERLYEVYVDPRQPLRPMLNSLITALQNDGSTELFLAKVYAEKPRRPDLRELIAGLMPQIRDVGAGDVASFDWQKAGEHEALTPGHPDAPGLQRRVRDLGLHDIGIWLEQGNSLRRKVCRIERNGRAVGTGFLVGPSAVLTNWHVIEAAMRDNRLGELQCTFDYVALGDGTRQSGRRIALAAPYCLDTSPYAAAETTRTPESPPPTAEELDYALLPLAEPAGQEPTDTGAARGWISLPAQAPDLPPASPLLIVQHPDGAPMKLALDTDAVIGRYGADRRIRYRTTTEPGSSGSPCLRLDWTLVALHHYGDPTWQQPRFNQGVPVELIRQLLVARGHGAWLG